jgi:hypothetical protein
MWYSLIIKSWASQASVEENETRTNNVRCEKGKFSEIGEKYPMTELM